MRPTLPSTRSAVVSFDPFTDLRTVRGIKGKKLFLMLRQHEEGCAESITLNDDFIAIGRKWRRSAGDFAG